MTITQAVIGSICMLSGCKLCRV